MLDIEREKKIERYLRNRPWLLYLSTFLMASLFYFGIYVCLIYFNEGYYIALIPSGLFAHSFFVITMHDGVHKAITKTKFDHFIMNFCSGLIILPFYTELFKRYHLIHHAHTNEDVDPLWSDNKKRLFEERRLLYAFLQCLPFAFNLAILFGYKKRLQKKPVNAPKVNPYYMLLSVVIATSIILLIQPSFWFIFGTLTMMTTLGAFRYWGEHMGIAKNKESNTHWFPLGMGIGNHEVHHFRPGYSWLTLSLGMFYRKMDTNPLKSFYRILTDKSFHHYKPKKENRR